MKTSVSLLSIAALLALTGCNNRATPETTAASAYSDIQKGDLAHFQSLLTGAALDQYGNEAGMQELQQKLAGTHPQVGEQELLSKQGDSYEMTLVYDVPVLASNGDSVLDLEVVCQENAAATSADCAGTMSNLNQMPGCTSPNTESVGSCMIDSISF